MSKTTLDYGVNTTIVMDASSLASNASFIIGVESNQVDNTVDKFVEVMIQGKVIVGTTPVVGTFINVYVWGSNVSLATTALDTLDGTASGETLANTGVLNTAFRLGASIGVLAATSGVGYDIAPFPLSSLFGAVPKFWGMFLAHNTGVALGAANSNLFTFNGIKYESL
jgi:hypothetical protein